MKHSTRLFFLWYPGLALIVSLFFAFTASVHSRERPNILWITSEDNSANLMGCYGNELAVTPNIDALAEQGILYEHAFANAPVCAPARNTIISGMYASSNGTHHMRSNYKIQDEVRFFPEYLRQAGYYCTNNSKTDYNVDRQQWNENVSRAWNESSGTAHYKNRKPGQPFFAVFNVGLSHEHKIHDDHLIAREDLEHEPENMPLAPYHPDVPEMRHCYASYYDYITRMDAWVGEKLKELEERGLAENTIVFYYGDHGGVLPRSKRFLFESGTRVPMIVRFPEKYRKLAPGRAGSREDRLVSFVDLAPTVLSLAGIDIPAYMQGKAFLGNQKTEDPAFVHFFRGRMDERYDMMRGIRDQQFHYIRNYMPHRIYGQHLNYLWNSPSTRAWEETCKDGNCNEIQNRFWGDKPAEELYHIEDDPHNIHNLAGDPRYRDVLLRMRAGNQSWIRENRDPGFLPEGMMTELAGEGTIHELVHSGEYPAEAIISTAEMASRMNPVEIPQLIDKLDHVHPAVRYWAATGCTIQGKNAEAGKEALQNMLDDPYGNNRIAAAEALCKMGLKDEALQVLVEELDNENSKVQLHALNVLEVLEGEGVSTGKWIQEVSPANKSGYFKRAYQTLGSE